MYDVLMHKQYKKKYMSNIHKKIHVKIKLYRLTKINK